VHQAGMGGTGACVTWLWLP